jgi:hypothetical protein
VDDKQDFVYSEQRGLFLDYLSELQQALYDQTWKFR